MILVRLCQLFQLLALGCMLVGLGGGMLLRSSALAQEQTVDLAKTDPSDLYFQGWLLSQEADKLHQKKQNLKAYRKLESAKKLFDTIAIYHPDWKPQMLEGRLNITLRTLKELHPEAAKSLEDHQQKTAPLAANAASSQNLGLDLTSPSPPPQAPDPQTPPPPVGKPKKSQPAPSRSIAPPEAITQEEKEQFRALHREIEELKAQLADNQTKHDAETARIRRQLKEREERRVKLARQTLQDEITRLEQEIDQLKRERRTLDLALQESRKELKASQKLSKQHETEAKEARQRANELYSLLEKERSVSNKVVTGLRSQISDLKTQIREKESLLSAERAKNTQLQALLDDARAEIADLQSERQELQKERDHLATLLNVNQADRMQLLIEQNMTLARDLREAKKTLEQAQQTQDATNDDLLTAKRDLAIAKKRILDLQSENRAQTERLSMLESKLASAHTEIEARLEQPRVDPALQEELELLREVSKRLLTTLNRRQKADAKLLATVKRLGLKDKDFQIQLTETMKQEVTLTSEEQQLLQDQPADAQLTLKAQRASPRERQAAQRSLERRVEDMTRLVERMFAKKRLNGALDLCDSILDEHPFHYETLLNKGVILLGLNRPDDAEKSFQDAITIQGQLPSPRAHFLLGSALYQLQKYEQALTSFQRALETRPEDAQAHTFVGTCHAQLKQNEPAEEHFLLAIKYDPNLPEPYYNLAYICSAENARHEEGQDYYRQYLLKGGTEDRTLETRLDLNPKLPANPEKLPTPSVTQAS